MVLLIGAAAWLLAGCHTASRQAAGPLPETEQVVSEELKEMYMAASAAPRQSPEQQRLFLRMAQKAANGKEVLLVMRATQGVYTGSAGAANSVENQVVSLTTNKIMQCGTLEQLVDYARLYSVDRGHAHAYLQRMFVLGTGSEDPRVWYEIRSVAFRLKEAELEQQALAKATQLSSR